MNVFRTSCAAWLWLGFLAAAQAQTPLPAPPVATGAPQPLPGTESPPPEAPVEFKPGILGKSAQTPITANELGIVDGPPVGTLDDSNGGLGQSMWSNSPRGEVEDLLGRIPLVSADPFVRGLARRVVLTSSDAPVGPAKRALVTIRVEKLLQAGLIVDAGAIGASLQLNGNSDFARVQADALLYAGRDKDVCSDLTATRLTSAEPFWLQLRTWCFAVAGDTASAELTHAVMDAQGATDKAFDTLAADALNGKKTPPGDIAHPSALHIYLLRKAGFPVTATIAARLGTAAELLAVREPRNGAADRLAAATRISQTGALGTAEIVALLNAQAIPDEQLAHAADVAAKLPFLPAQSLLRRAAKLETRPAEKAAILSTAIGAFGHPDRLTLTALLQGDLVASIKPDASMAAQRPVLARALVLSGRTDAASGWYSSSPDDADLHAFQVLLALAAPSAVREAAAQSALSWFALHAAPQQNPAPLAALALGLSDVLGKPMSPDAKALAATLEGMRWTGAARRPSATDVRELESAASQPGRKGEAALRVLDIVGANGPWDLPADVTIECVRVLQQAGLTQEARALAIEALAGAASAP